MNLPNNMIVVDGAMKFAADPKSVLLIQQDTKGNLDFYLKRRVC